MGTDSLPPEKLQISKGESSDVLNGNILKLETVVWPHLYYIDIVIEIGMVERDREIDDY